MFNMGIRYSGHNIGFIKKTTVLLQWAFTHRLKFLISYCLEMALLWLVYLIQKLGASGVLLAVY